MAFDKKTWRNYPNTTTPITAEDLNRIEDGVVDANWDKRPALLSTADIYSLESGMYHPISTTAARVLGLPGETNGTLTVVNQPNHASITWEPTIPDVGGRYEVWRKYKRLGVWSDDWVRDDGITRGTLLTRDSDIDNLQDGVYHSINNTTSDMIGLPSANNGFLIQRSTATVNKIQTWTPISSNNRIFSRSSISSNWSPWAQIAPTEFDRALPSKHDVKTAEANRVWGVRRVPENKIAVALIFDHGTNVFHEDVVPKLAELGMTATIALNSHMYDPSQVRYEHDNRTDWGDVRSWWVDHGIEIANHGTDHKATSKTKYEELEYTIAGGLRELEDNLPGVPIVSWVNAAGVGPIEDLKDYHETLQGQVIHANHAFMTGSVNKYGYDLDLDGRPKYGQMRRWIDGSNGPTSLKNTLGNMPLGKGVMISGHPEVWGRSGNVTTQQVLEFLQWLKDNDNRYEVMTFAELNMARVSPL